MRVWPHFSQSRTSPLRPFAGHPWRRVQLPHVTAATAVSTRQHAVPIGSVAGAWRLARSLLIRSSRSITAPLDLLRAYTGERVIPHSLRTCPEPCKAVRCWVSPCFKGPRGGGGDTGLLARNSWSFENKFLALQSRAAQPSLVFSDHGDQDTRGGHFSIFGTIRPNGELTLFHCSRQLAGDARKKLTLTYSPVLQGSKSPCDIDLGLSILTVQ